MGSINVIKASAGSGKTYRLAYEYVRTVIAAPHSYRNILAVTFTNKATDEMKQRIVREINDLANGSTSNYMAGLQSELSLTPEVIRLRAAEARTKILHDYSHFAVLTIDKFFQRIIRAFIRELHIDINFNIELQTDSLLSAATDRLIDSISTDRDLRRWLEQFVEEKIDRSSRWDVKSELTALGKEIFKESYKSIPAPPPSAKEMNEIMGKAIGRVNKVSAEIKGTAETLLAAILQEGLTTADFPHGSGGFIGYVEKCAEGQVLPYGKRVEDALGDNNKWYSQKSPAKARISALVPALRPMLEKIVHLYDTDKVFINTTALLRERYRSFALLNDIARHIQDICAEQTVLPISETNIILHKLIAGNDAPFIFEKVGNYYSHYMIDEFQDTSRMQWDNFRPLLDNAISQYPDSEHPVLLVGDVKQAIYRWRGGDWQIMGSDISSQFKSITSSPLGTNYRSAENIIEFNNSAIEAAVRICDDMLNGLLSEAAEAGSLPVADYSAMKGMVARAYEGHRQLSRDRSGGGFIHITEYQKSRGEDDSPTDQDRLIETINDLEDRGFRPRDIAILVRANSEGAVVADMLLDHKSRNTGSHYRYDVVTQEALSISSSPCVKFIISCLYISDGSAQSIRQGIYNQWLGRSVSEPIGKEEHDFLLSLRLLSLEEAFEEILLRYGLNSRSEEIAYIQALHEQVITFSSTKISDIPLFLRWWEETGSSQSISMPDGQDAITITSIHKAKGLEYKAVILPYCNWSLSPMTGSTVWARCSGEFEALGYAPVGYKNIMAESIFAPDYYRERVLTAIDNLNTLYVALTRAEQELHIMIPRRGRNESDSAGTLLLNGIATEGDTALIGNLRGERRPGNGQTEYLFGKPSALDAAEEAGKDEVTTYPSFRIGQRIRLRFNSERYFTAGEEVRLSPRSHGMMMHRIFENISSLDEIPGQLRRMQGNGELSESEVRELSAKIETAVANPLVRSWFDPSWSEIRNESSIIVPRSPSLRRPDRVMTKDNTAAVVDYKFGNKTNKAYNRQIAEYMSLLRDMGYKNVTGYIWYVEQDIIETVA